MHSVRLRVSIFIILFTAIFLLVRYFHLLPHAPYQNFVSIPWLFSAISLIFSIISGFVIQSKWQTWDQLIDATHGELSSFRQLHILSHHFPKNIQKRIKENICAYLSLMVKESLDTKDLNIRSEKIEASIYQLEETIFEINYMQHPNTGVMAFDLVRKCMDYREKRLQNIAHRLPLGVKAFVMVATFCIIFSSLFIGEINSLIYDYLFTLIIGILAFGIYALIDDLDNPYRPGQWHLKIDDYKKLLEEIKKDTIIHLIKKNSYTTPREKSTS